MTITVEIRDNLVGTFISGDHVVVNGILKTEADVKYNNILLFLSAPARC